MMDFQTTINFGDLGDTELPASFSADSDGNVWLENVKLGGLNLADAQVRIVLGDAEYSRQVALVQSWWTETGWAQWEADQAANEADAANDWAAE